MLDYNAIVEARERLAPYLTPTPLEHAPHLGDSVWLKLENTNKTHSFKVRGALNAALSLNAAQRRNGIVTASSGNHAQGIAYASNLLNIPAQILMPITTPRRKVSGVRRHGAQAILQGMNYDETEAEAHRIAAKNNLTYISPYNDERVIAGAGTVGLEIIEQLPDVQRVIVPVSGGGLISGIAIALKSINPDIEIIGVNAVAAPAMYNFLYGTNLPQEWETLAEALSGEIETGSVTFEIVKELVNGLVLVDETAIGKAIHWMLTEQGWLVEGGGAVAIAAALTNAILLDERPTVVIVSGSNIDPDNLERVMCR